MKTFNKFSSLRSEQSQISEAQFSKQDLEDMANLEESEISWSWNQTAKYRKS